jgi:predicted phosphoadenosine phosphosulfate sulfurtransferase
MDIHINHVPKLIKWKNKTTLIDFMNRFYTPSIFIMAFLTMFGFIDTTNIWILIPLAITSALIQSYYVWIRWKKDFMYLAEIEYVIPMITTTGIICTETMIQSIANMLIYWCLQDIPYTIEKMGMSRSIQSTVWLLSILLLLAIHIIQWKLSARKMDALIRRTYEHVSPV